MPVLCNLMRQLKKPEDQILAAPPKGNGPSLTIRYFLSAPGNANRAQPDAGSVRIADEIWIATALLHGEQPNRDDFTVQEILERAGRENLGSGTRPGLAAHAYAHCVANRPPNPTGYRMLYATGSSTRRLYRPADPADPNRNGKTKPRREQIPAKYHPLLDWYEREYYNKETALGQEQDPILALRGLGSEIWQDEDPDRYVRSLRDGWQ